MKPFIAHQYVKDPAGNHPEPVVVVVVDFVVVRGFVEAVVVDRFGAIRSMSLEGLQLEQQGGDFPPRFLKREGKAVAQ